MTSVHPSARLYREGEDLDEVLTELDGEFPGQVHVVDVNYDRDGGVLGFFAKRRVGVTYELTSDSLTAESIMGDALTGSSPLDALLSAAEGGDHIGVARPAPSPAITATGGDPGNVEFARMLLDAATAKAAQRQADRAVTAPETGGRAPVTGAFDEAAQPAPSAPSALSVPSVPAPAPTPPVERATLPLAHGLPAAFTPVTWATPADAPQLVTAPVTPQPSAEAPVVRPSAQEFAAATAAPVSASSVETVYAPAHAAAPQPFHPSPTGHRPTHSAAPVAPAPVAFVPATPVAPTPIAPTPVAPAADPIPAPAPAPAQPTAVLPRAAATPQPATAPRPQHAGAHRMQPAEHGGTATSATEYALRRQLIELGVPVSWVPDAVEDAYWAVEQLSAQAPVAAPLTLPATGVLAVVGPALEALRAAEQACRRLRVPADRVLAVGCPDGLVPAERSVAQPIEAARAVAVSRSERHAPTVVVVATDAWSDDVDDDGLWLRDAIRSLAADHVWLVVDAAHKPADSRALMQRVGGADGLVVTGASRTSSPASVWELGVPVALVDGRPASRGAWAVLLIDKLAAMNAS